ncbi:diacylglycerol O-acyltransferase 3 [Ricinus communis]|uniref:Soluble diacylglycerol acyltransferase n=1 Tax=Ricinus communis TaxID=3988 RepID=B9S020_RICCO|nr:diacylglycerol O-acyltransferase 3 [Ricinus communis]EEF43203.1 soluble diacylglycerol acyltransferase [Ricinus communis]|eukprot:XP_002519339.1 diacylglycerol O-acyltransferase 3, cytosolic [Ricinus communis]
MEVSGLGCFSSAATPSLCGAVDSGGVSSLRPRKAFHRVSDSCLGFRDNGHLQYYCQGGFVRCGGGNKKSIKKKLKLVKSLSEDFSMFPHNNALLHQPQSISLQEAAQGLMKQLQELRAKEKELKRQKKQEKKAKLKSESSSSSSSESSSDSERGEVIHMSRFRDETIPAALPQLHPLTHHHPTSTLPVSPTQECNPMDYTSTHHEKRCCVGPSTGADNAVGDCCNDRNSSMTEELSANRIEVCMGNKCKKSGGAALLEEFQRVLGVEAAVVGCKCMGNCRDGPNVRVRNSVQDRNTDDSVRTPSNPLCIGVGLEDVDVIVANFFGLGLAPAS